jgi:hypothetical protein
VNPPETPRLSDWIDATVRHGGEGGVQVGAALDAAADRGFGLLLFVVAFPAIVPLLPPGASMVVGILAILVAVQMLFGRSTPWMPARLRRFTFSAAASESLRRHGVRWAKRIEGASRPRWPALTGRIALVPVALLVIANGVVLFLPLPFLNTAPALAIMVIGLGLFNRDGVFVLGGMAGCLVIAAIVALSPALVMRSLDAFR